MANIATKEFKKNSRYESFIKMFFVFTLIILGSLVFSREASATVNTYYISTSGVDSSSQDGSSNTPWKTLAYACSHATTSGDLIHVNAGTYDETAQCVLAPGVSLIGEGLTSIIKSTTTTAEWTPIIQAGSDAMTDGGQSISYLNFDGGLTTTSRAINVSRRNNVTINNCNFKDFKYQAVEFDGDMNSNMEIAPHSYATGNTFHDNTMTNDAIYSGFGHGALDVNGQIGMLIYNNNINQSGRTAGTNGWLIKMGSVGGWIKGCKIYNNILFKSDLTYFDFAIELASHAEGLEIYNNTITGSIDINWASKGSYDYGVYIHNNTLGPLVPVSEHYIGVILEFDISDAIITKNEIRNCANGIYYSPRAGTAIADNEISYNIFHDLGMGNADHFFSAIDIPNSSSVSYTVARMNIYNNVFHTNTSADVYFGIAFSAPNASFINIINNIFVNFNYEWLSLNPSNTVNGINIKNNITYNNGSSNAPGFNTGTPANYVNSGNLTSDPLFISGTDFHLQATSPAINAGTDVGLTEDYEGNPITGNPDIGAYEFQAPTSPTSLSQYKSNGTTPITSGTFTNEDSLVLKFNMSSLNSSDSLTPQIEIQESGTSFTNTVTNSGNTVAYSGTSVTGIVTVTGLISGKTYHWQARVSNLTTTSAWVSMGGNPDFGVITTVPENPIATPVANSYNSTQSVTLSAVNSNYIKYSIDSLPADCSSGTSYGGPISVVTSQTIYVRACDNAGNSSTATFVYTIDTTAPLTPVATPPSGIYNSTQTVSLTAGGSDSIRYSTSATPTDCSAGTLYSNSTPIVVSSTQTIYVRACDLANNSSTGSFAYTIDTTPPETPTAIPSAGSFNSTQSVTLNATGSDYIKYDTSLIISCSSGTSYGGPISIPSSETIYVLACDNAGNSSTTNFAYVIAPVVSHSSGGNYPLAIAQFKAAQQVLTPTTTQTPVVTPTPSVPFTPIVLSRIIKLSNTRMWGDDVLAIQTLLNTKGYDVGIPDGNFGPKTQAAVVAFQKANGLTPDGSVGTNTLKYLNGNQTDTTATSTITIQPTVARILKLSVPRMIGDDIKALQTYLSTNGYDVGTPDGIFGTKTRIAIIAFQTANGLNPDGLVGAKTRELMK